MEYGLVGLYLAAIVVANLTVAAFGPSVAVVNAFVLISLDLTTRDRLHELWHGRRLWLKMALLIAAGSMLSYLLNRAAGRIALASFAAFAVSETADALVYSRLERQPWGVRTNGSNLASAALDSLIFPYMAFSSFLPWITLGQFAAKVLGGAVWAFALGFMRRAARSRVGQSSL